MWEIHKRGVLSGLRCLYKGIKFLSTSRDVSITCDISRY